MIETAQRAGLTLDEIRVLLEASPGDVGAVERLESAAECCCPSLDDCPLFDEPDRAVRFCYPNRTTESR